MKCKNCGRPVTVTLDACHRRLRLHHKTWPNFYCGMTLRGLVTQMVQVDAILIWQEEKVGGENERFEV